MPFEPDLPELELPAVAQFLEEEALEEELLLVGLWRFLPAPETNSISSRDKTRIIYSLNVNKMFTYTNI